MSANESKGSFSGVFTLRTAGEAQELAGCVKNIVERAVNLFYVIKVDTGAKNDLLRDLRRADELVATYPSICPEGESKQAALGIVSRVHSSTSALAGELNAHESGDLSADQQRAIAGGMKAVLDALVEVVVHMEQQQKAWLMAVLREGFQQILVLKETRSDYRFSEKVRAAAASIMRVVERMRKRADVTEKEAVRDRLFKGANTLEKELPNLIRSTRDVVQGGATDVQVNTQLASVKIMVLAIKDLQEICDESGSAGANASFSHDINEQIQALREAVRSGSTSAAVQSAKVIAAEVAALRSADADSLEAQTALNDSCDLLTGLTARLIEATKEALSEPGNDANLERAIAEMQSEVGKVELLHMPTSKDVNNDLKQSLLECSKELAGAMNTMGE